MLTNNESYIKFGILTTGIYFFVYIGNNIMFSTVIK